MASDLERALSGMSHSLTRLALTAYALRGLLALALWVAFGHREYTDDAAFHLGLAADPFAYFRCAGELISQQPPLLGLVETSLLPFVWLFGPFFGVRLAYSAWDIAGGVLLVRALSRQGLDSPLLRLVILFGPLNVYAAAVSAQDETITWFFFCACASLWAAGRVGFAFLLACLSTVAAKILFVPMALVLAPRLLTGRGLPFLALGFACAAAVYGWGASCRYASERYVLAASHTINGWQWFAAGAAPDWSGMLRQSAVAVMAIGLPLVLLTGLRRRGEGFQAGWPEPLAATLIGLFSFLGAFYHVVPEYFLAPLPLLMFLMRRAGVSGVHVALWCAGLAAMPIVPDVLRFFVRYGLGPPVLTLLHRWSSLGVSLGCVVAMGLVLALHLRPVPRGA